MDMRESKEKQMFSVMLQFLCKLRYCPELLQLTGTGGMLLQFALQDSKRRDKENLYLFLNAGRSGDQHGFVKGRSC